MKILITGPLGHIGSRFIHSINAGQFEEVRLIDNLSTQRYSSLFNLPKEVKFKFYEDDICTADLDSYFMDIDVVVHLAGITDAASSVNKKDIVEEVNFFGTEKVARACIKNKCKLIFPSTTSVYGSQEEVVDENCPIEELKPQSPYATSKLKAERLLEELGKTKDLRFITCRLGTIFGISVGMRFHTAVNKFCWQAVMGQPITVWRTALNQYRPYLDLGDAVEAFGFIIQENLFDRSIYNVLTTNVTVQGIIDVIREYIPDLSIEYVDTEIMNQLSYNVSDDRFKGTGFIPRGNMKKAIGETVNLLKAANVC